jgi:hypothetical protein
MTKRSAPSRQHRISTKVFTNKLSDLRFEVERLRDQQQALQRIPTSTMTWRTRNVTTHRADRGRVLGRRPVRLVLELVAAALLCARRSDLLELPAVVRMADDAEINGDLDNDKHAHQRLCRPGLRREHLRRKGQALVDLDPRNDQAAVENAAATSPRLSRA